MEIQALRLRLTDDDVARLLPLVPEDDLPAQEIKVRLTADGVAVEGKYPTLMLAVPFRMVWKLEAAEGKVRARLVELDFYGLPAGPLRGVILALVRDEVARVPGATLQGEAVLFDPAPLLAKLPVPVAVTPTEVRHEEGALVVVAAR